MCSPKFICTNIKIFCLGTSEMCCLFSEAKRTVFCQRNEKKETDRLIAYIFYCVDGSFGALHSNRKVPNQKRSNASNFSMRCEWVNSQLIFTKKTSHFLRNQLLHCGKVGVVAIIEVGEWDLCTPLI